MPNLANLSLEFIILALRIAVIFLLYLFLYQVVRMIVRELRSAGPEQAVTSQYGSLVLIQPGQSGLTPGKQFPLGAVNTIGRTMDNDIPLNDNFQTALIARLLDRRWASRPQEARQNQRQKWEGNCRNGKDTDERIIR